MFTRVLNFITKGVENVKKVAAITACIQASLTAWHTEWLKHFPAVIDLPVKAATDAE